MEFLNPWYLAGALAIAAPILLHLRRRPPKDFIPFSTLMFLENSPERLTRRSKLERWWLLLLRCAVLLLLALLFARPFFQSDVDGLGHSEGKRVVVLLDRSASMQRQGVWEDALDRAGKTLKEFSPSDEVVLATFDDKLTWYGEFSDKGGRSAGSALKALPSDIEPGWGSSQLGSALVEAADALEAADAGEGEGWLKEVVVISDFQEGSERDSLNRYAWPESVKVRCVTVDAKVSGNLAVHLVGTGASEGDAVDVEGDSESDPATRQRVRILNARGDGGEAGYSLRWESSDSSAGERVTGSVPPGGSRVVSVPPRVNETGDGVLVLEAGEGVAEVDDVFDNRAYVARVQPRKVQVLYLGEGADSEDPSSALFYVMRAMQPTSVLAPEVRGLAFADASDTDLVGAQVIVLSGWPPQELAAKVAVAVEAGAALLWTMEELPKSGKDVPMEVLRVITSQDGWSVNDDKRSDGKNDYAMLADLDFESPVLAPFARAKVRDFTGIHIWRHRSLGLPVADEAGDAADRTGDVVRVLARYDTGEPAWIDVRRGAGRIFLFTSGWEPSDSQLALSSKFVPLLYAMLGESGFSALRPPPLTVGQPLPLSVAAKADGGSVPVVLPNGERVEAAPGEGVFRATEMPGLYRVQTAEGERVYAVNLAPEESRVDAFDPLTLVDFSLPVLLPSQNAGSSGLTGVRAEEAQEKAVKDQRRLERSEKEKRQKVWKWLVLAVLGVLLLESWVAGRSPRQSSTEEGGELPNAKPESA